MGLVGVRRMKMIWIYDALMDVMISGDVILYMSLSTIASSLAWAETNSYIYLLAAS